MCSGRVDLEFILRAFSNGQDGVFIGGCRLDECNYVTHGNYDALSNTYIARKILEQIGLNPERLSIEFMSGGEGTVLVKVINDFSKRIRQIGPLGTAEGIDKKTLRFQLEAARKLVPYVKLVEREKMRIVKKSEKAYREFFASAEMSDLYDELIRDKLVTSQITTLLKDGPLSTKHIAEALNLAPQAVSRHMNLTSRQGLIRYDTKSNCYTLS